MSSFVVCSLRYNSTTHTSHNARGVDIRIQNFGETKTVEWLDPDDYIHRISSRECAPVIVVSADFRQVKIPVNFPVAESLCSS